MTSDAVALLSVAVGVAVLAVQLWLGVKILPQALTVAKDTQEWAWEQGPGERVIYVALWLFMFPVMAIICLVGGGLIWYAERRRERQKEHGEDM